MKQKHCIIYLVRHGETDWNVERLIQGQWDVPLNENGRRQAERLAESLKNINFDAVYCSDLSRATETAKIVIGDRKLKITGWNALRERYFGKYQGVSFKVNHDGIFNKIKNMTAEERKSNLIEDENEMKKRFINYIREISAKNTGKTVLVISHAGPIRLFLIDLNPKTYKNIEEGDIGNSSYTRLIGDGTSFMINKTSGVMLE